MSLFTKATKKKSKARITLDGPAGSGKTFSSLVLAKELAGPDGKIAVIDSEHGSASLYSDVFNFDTAATEDHSPQTYISMIEGAGKAGYDVLIIDSLSHAWMGKGGVLEQVDREKDKFGSGWRKMTPLHNRLVDAILSYPGHVITTLRTKMDYVQEKDQNGRTTIRKVGMAPVQREGMEYEFTVVADLSIDGNLTISKTRCSALDDKLFTRKDMPKIAATLKAWLDAGEAVEAPPVPAQGHDVPVNPVPSQVPSESTQYEKFEVLMRECSNLDELSGIAKKIKDAYASKLISMEEKGLLGTVYLERTRDITKERLGA